MQLSNGRSTLQFSVVRLTAAVVTSSTFFALLFYYNSTFIPGVKGVVIGIATGLLAGAPVGFLAFVVERSDARLFSYLARWTFVGVVVSPFMLRSGSRIFPAPPYEGWLQFGSIILTFTFFSFILYVAHRPSHSDSQQRT